MRKTTNANKAPPRPRLPNPLLRLSSSTSTPHFLTFSSSLPSHSCRVEIAMAVLQIFVTIVLLVALLTIRSAIRRLFFHPLAHIPGPRLAALTWWYEFYFDAIQPGRYVFKIQELHKRYGKPDRCARAVHSAAFTDLPTLQDQSSGSPRTRFTSPMLDSSTPYMLLRRPRETSMSTN